MYLYVRGIVSKPVPSQESVHVFVCYSIDFPSFYDFAVGFGNVVVFLDLEMWYFWIWKCCGIFGFRNVVVFLDLEMLWYFWI